MIILDTDVISLLDAKSDPAYRSLLLRLADNTLDRVCVTIVSFEEQMRGWLSYIAASRTPMRQVEGYSRLQRMHEWYAEQEVPPFDSTVLAVFERLKRLRTRVGTMDLKIAAIALANSALLVSRNIRDFERIPELRVQDWTTPA